MKVPTFVVALLFGLTPGCFPVTDNPDNCVWVPDPCKAPKYCDPFTAACRNPKSDEAITDWRHLEIDPALPVADSVMEDFALKRDPSYLVADGRRLFYFSGSPQRGSAWSLYLAYGKDEGDAGLRNSINYVKFPANTSNSWDAGQNFAPGVVYTDKTIPQMPSRYSLYYTASGDPRLPKDVTQIGLLSSNDGIHYSKRATPVLEQTPTDAGISYPAPVVVGRYLFLYYTALICTSAGCRYQIQRAISLDGIHFRDPEPVLVSRTTFKEEVGGVAAPSVVHYQGRFYMLFSALPTRPNRDLASQLQALSSGILGIAHSVDGKIFNIVQERYGFLPQNELFGNQIGNFSANLSPKGNEFLLHFAGSPSFGLLRTVFRPAQEFK